MTFRPALLAAAVAMTLGLAACKQARRATTGATPPPAGETADQFVARVNKEFRSLSAD